MPASNTLCHWNCTKIHRSRKDIKHFKEIPNCFQGKDLEQVSAPTKIRKIKSTSNFVIRLLCGCANHSLFFFCLSFPSICLLSLWINKWSIWPIWGGTVWDSRPVSAWYFLQKSAMKASPLLLIKFLNIDKILTTKLTLQYQREDSGCSKDFLNASQSKQSPKHLFLAPSLAL